MALRRASSGAWYTRCSKNLPAKGGQRKGLPGASSVSNASMQTADIASAPSQWDLIVVGSGVAGLRAAIEAAEGGLTVALLAKDSAHDSSTDLAQGGVAVALSDEDQVGLHYSDT